MAVGSSFEDAILFGSLKAKQLDFPGSFLGTPQDLFLNYTSVYILSELTATLYNLIVGTANQSHVQFCA